VSAVHLPTADDLWQDVPMAQRRKDPGYWIVTEALRMEAWFKFVDTLELLESAHGEMFAQTGKSFAVLTGERYFSNGNPGTAGRLRAFGWGWERDGKAQVKLVRLAEGKSA
jgi:hypothetical protein